MLIILQTIFAAMLIALSDYLFYGCATISAILLFYYLYFFSRLAFFKPKETDTHTDSPVSIIVCSRDELNNLRQNVPQILQQQYEAPFELLVVNDNSSDNTRHEMQWLSLQQQRLKVINIDSEASIYTGKKYPLSIGIREATHGHLLLTDADCAPASENWSSLMMSAFSQQTEIVIGYGAYQKLPGLLNKIIRFETFHSALQYLSYALAGLPYMGVGRNLSYKKELFSRHRGFASINHIPGGDDDLFINKAATNKNTAIVTNPNAHTISIPKKSWGDWKRQKTRHYSTSKYYKPKHKFLLGLYSLSQFLFYPLLITTAILFSWQIAVGIFVVKSTIQYIVFSKAMKQLNESDLIGWIVLMDMWMFFYYLLFAKTLWKKEKKKW